MKKNKKQLTPKQKKQQRIFFGVLAAIVIIAIILHFRKKKADNSEIQAEIAKATSTPSSTSTQPKVSSSGLPILGNTALLKRGTKSAEVRWVQWDFNQRIAKPNNYTLLSEDGIFGPKTETAVYSVLKKKTTSWAEWKNFVDKLKSQ